MKIENLISGKSPREKYLNVLQKSGLADRELLKNWKENFNQALLLPTPIDIPYAEQLLFAIGDLRADAFLIDIPAGREVRITQERVIGRGELFMEARHYLDLEEQIGKRDSLGLLIESEKDAKQLILIFQTELMAYGNWNIRIAHMPSLGFPVQGKDASSVGSFFGDPRDGGARKHHGIDIFADRGTPALAVEDGWIHRTGQNNLGGNVVWLNSKAGNIYYAHLDSIAVKSPKRVHRGDTLGFVGNTGNAKYTPPHLHFGIYQNGPIDPLPYVKEAGFPQSPPNYDLESKKLRMRSNGNLRAAASTRSIIITQLEKGSLLWALGQKGDWLRIWTEKGIGFLHSSLVKEAEVDQLKLEFHP